MLIDSLRSIYAHTWSALGMLLALAVLVMLSAQGAQAQLIGYYTFDGNDAADGSGFGNAGTVGANVAFSSSVPTALGSGQSAVFDGTSGGNGLISVPNSASLQAINDSLTVSFWINMDHTANPNWVRVTRKASEGNPSSGWIVNRNSNTSDLLMRTDTQGVGGAFNQNRGQGVGTGMLNGTWQHYTHVRDNGTWIEYVNGVQTGTGTYPHGTGFGNTQPLLIGGRGGGDNMVGSLDDYAIFNRRLDPTEVTALANGAIAPSGLVTGITVSDDAGNWNVASQNFLPIGSTMLPTLEVAETATDVGPFDLEISVADLPVGGETNITVAKDVTNSSNVDWAQFELSVGTGLGDSFVESDALDGLYLGLNTQEAGTVFDITEFDDALEPNNALFTALAVPGLAMGDSTDFLIDITVSDDIDGIIDGQAVFTLRQSAVATPEPASIALWTMLGVALAGFGYRRARRK